MSSANAIPQSALDLIEAGRSSRVSDIKKDRGLSLNDLDGTHTAPGSELLVETFVRQVVIGNTKFRRKLLDCFDQWHDARRIGNPNYENYLQNVGELWAMMLRTDDNDRPISRHKVIEVGGEWFKDRGQHDILPYSNSVFRLYEKLKLRSALVTGAPFELAVHYMDALGIPHGFAMDAEVNSNMEYTGKMRYEANTGLRRNKAEICTRLSEALHRIVAAAGDTVSDSSLFLAAMNAQFAGDMKGAAFLMNPRPEVQSTILSVIGSYNDDGQLHVLPRSFTSKTVVKIFRQEIGNIFTEHHMTDGADMVALS